MDTFGTHHMGGHFGYDHNMTGMGDNYSGDFHYHGHGFDGQVDFHHNHDSGITNTHESAQIDITKDTSIGIDCHQTWYDHHTIGSGCTGSITHHFGN